MFAHHESNSFDLLHAHTLVVPATAALRAAHAVRNAEKHAPSQTSGRISGLRPHLFRLPPLAASLCEHTVRVADGLFVTVGPEARIQASDCKRQKANTQASVFLPFAGFTLAFDDCMAERV